jgi:hypothetical protein
VEVEYLNAAPAGQARVHPGGGGVEDKYFIGEGARGQRLGGEGEDCEEKQEAFHVVAFQG